MKRIVLALLCLLPVAANAQEPWPSRPLSIIVPYGPGAAPDLVARALADQLAPALGQPVLVVNRVGSSGLIGVESVARARPDGYTLLIGNDGLLAIAPHVFRNLPYDPVADFAPISSLVENSFLLAINSTLPATDLRSFLDHARRADKPLAYGSAGNASQSHLMMERLARLAGVSLLHVPYRTNNHAGMGVATGEVVAAFVGVGGLPHIKAGRIRPVATTSLGRSRAFPELPSLNETFPGLEMTNWQGLLAPAGTPEPVLRRLAQEAHRIFTSEDLGQRLAGGGDMRVTLLGPREFAGRILADGEKYRAIVKEIGLTPD